MSEKLEVGMYVRTEKGIAKYLGLGKKVLKDDGSSSYNHWKSKHIFDDYIFDEEYGDTLTILDNIDKIIVGKPSFNLIDLIEIGDYVNGVEVEDINDKEIMLADTHLWIDKEVANRLIESIVTKEQFENVSYEVKKNE